MRPLHAPLLVNDIHSALNETLVAGIHQPRCIDEIRVIIADAVRHDMPLAICGGRHAMGGQQFAADAALLDMRHMNHVLAFDAVAGLIEVEAGIERPELIGYFEGASVPDGQRWSIRQKQTGADRLSLGGCLSANIHGRGLHMRPFIGDVEAFRLVDANGDEQYCSWSSNRELFSLRRAALVCQPRHAAGTAALHDGNRRSPDTRSGAVALRDQRAARRARDDGQPGDGARAHRTAGQGDRGLHRVRRQTTDTLAFDSHQCQRCNYWLYLFLHAYQFC